MGSVLDKNSSLVRKRIEGHSFTDEGGEEYEGSEFNGFGDYFRRKKIKLQNLDADMRSASDKPQLFKGIVAHVTGYTQPPLHILHREIVQHGGGFLQYLDSKTMATHIIASTLPPKKSVDFSRYRIVKPAWIMDSIAAGKLLPWADYRVLDEGPRQKVLKFDGIKGVTQVSPRSRQGYREQTDSSFYTSQLKNSGSGAPSQPWSQMVEKTNTPKRSPLSEAAKSTGPASTESPSLETPSKLPKEGGQPPNVERDLVVSDAPPADPTLESLASTRIHSEAVSRNSDPPKNVTPEEHNAWLLSDPRMRKSSTANPDFLKQFYSESRLHHLSTWKAELKSKMQRMAAEKGAGGKPVRRNPASRRYIMHVDFDSFFCAVSLKRHPEYADKPAVVAHGSGAGSEIASCNYPARKYGVKNGMWMKRALELCGDLKVLPYDFPAYEEASRLFYESILQVGGTVQSVSVDEALVDISSVVLSATGSQGVGVDEGSIWREQEKADEIAWTLRESIENKTGCHVSAGIGGNILQAKVALRKAKPAGQYQLRPEDVLDVIGELKAEDLPGVAYSIRGKLEEIGVRFVKDLRDLSRERLSSALGPKTGEKLWDYARGIDKVEVGEQPPRKSVSAEVNWGIRFISQPEAEEFVHNLSKELERRLLNEQVKGTQLTMKIMRRSLDAPLDPAKHLGHGKCDVFNKSTTFGVATHSCEAIGREAVSILRSFKFSPGDLRGLGVQMTKLEPIKSNPSAPEGSQRKLTFNAAFTGPSSGRKNSTTEQIDESESPTKASTARPGGYESDPIADDPLTPRKQKVHPAMALARAGEKDARARTPLNVSGTQFLIPSNADPAVIAELPNDIRSKLMAQKASPAISRSASPVGKSRSESPVAVDVLPSQVDAEVFNALPDDVKAEVLASYGRKPAQAAHRSPRKDRTIQPRKPTTPTKRGGIRGLFGKAQRQRDAEAGLLQTNFRNARVGSEGPQEEVIEELDAEFLAELPEDVRKEVIADHRRRILAQRSGLDAPPRRQQHNTEAEAALPGGQRRIEFPAPPPKITFSGLRTTSAVEIKEMLDAWHTETRDDGPHGADVEVLEKYLERVVLEERDMEKAVKLLRWLDLLVEQDGVEGRGQQGWRDAVKRVKAAVQGAARERGLGHLAI
ncbi:DNA repair protein-like protein [Hapsidospora chrysogenum ATCC 11550]|uniref:DNA repair protein REV1 n=1 Tax=Hapsidospora chrysogenum (strain ATCC 11550 / CBS 779.69 / DSM 880 / IAM 14645 / JCM 23072 / IMI 49137) TaxID=857340 RepID=A0A086T6L9_HAPC1|nr:DNA repair protein-like protein [Hapsidospora chrysogenum ATCC 11550]